MTVANRVAYGETLVELARRIRISWFWTPT